jgi:hypothetical protein
MCCFLSKYFFGQTNIRNIADNQSPSIGNINEQINLEAKTARTYSLGKRILCVASIIILPIVGSFSPPFIANLSFTASAVVIAAFAIKYFFNKSRPIVEKRVEEREEHRPPASPFIPSNKQTKDIAKLEIKVSDEIKKQIKAKTFSPEKIKEDYNTLSKERKIPELCGYSKWARLNFALLMPGIALVASKFGLPNLWVCDSHEVLQDKLKEIQNSDSNLPQRYAFIIMTHSLLSGEGHAKKDNWEQHKLAVCVEKINGNMHIYVLETMLAFGNEVITEAKINLDENQCFTELELLLAYIDAVKLDKVKTTIYLPVTRREFGTGCSIFALRDAVYFLRDEQFSNKVIISTQEKMKLPISQVVIKNIEALPPQFMQLTQSMTVIGNYKSAYPELAAQEFGTESRKRTLESSLAIHTFRDFKDHPQNLHVGHRVLKYQALILETLKQKNDEEINALIDQTLLKKAETV